MHAVLLPLLLAAAAPSEPTSASGWTVAAFERVSSGDTSGARAAFLQAAYLDETSAPASFLAAARLAEADGDTGSAWWMYRRGLLSPSASGSTREGLATGFARLGGLPSQAAASDAVAAPAPAQGSDRTPRFSWDVSLGWLTNDNLILQQDRVPAQVVAGQVAQDVGQTASGDFALLFPIDDRSQFQVGFGASGSLYNAIPSPDERLLVGSLGYARSFGKRWLVEVSPYLYDDAVGHDRYLYAWGNPSQVTYVAAPRWSIVASHTYERDRYPNAKTLDGPVWDYAGTLVFRPDADREGAAALAENEFRFGHHQGLIGPRDGSEHYTYRRYKAEVEYDLFRRWHLDADLSLDEREFANHPVGGPNNRSRRQDIYWAGEVGIAYKFWENWRLRAYFSSFQNTADFRQMPSDSYKSDEVGLALRWTGWRPVTGESPASK